MGGGPQDSLSLSPDGTAFYRGEGGVARVGSWQGTFSQSDFDTLAAWLVPALPPLPSKAPVETLPVESVAGRVIPHTVEATPACSDAAVITIGARIEGHFLARTYACDPPRFVHAAVARFEAVMASISWARTE